MSSSFVLGSSKSSTYPRGYASGFDSPVALPDEHFEHPVRSHFQDNAMFFLQSDEIGHR